MDDARLHALRADPPPEFAERLRDRLRQQPTTRAHLRSSSLIKIAASIAVVGATAGLLSVPAVRASARSFLALFRVVNFVAVPVDSERIKWLESQRLDPFHLIGERVEVLEDSGPATPAVSPEQAGAAAGIDVRLPSQLPPRVSMVGITVRGQNRLRVLGDVTRLQQVMDSLSIRDLTVPDSLDGQPIDIRIPPVVAIKYELPQIASAQFYQALSPEVSLPNGIDVRQLGEIGLRILGLPPLEAHEFAQSIDWSSTLVVPVPVGVTSFKQVDINGHRGVVVERWVENQSNGLRRRLRALMWSANGRVFGIEGTLNLDDVLVMAQSVR